ncbi:MAG: flagellar hook-associated protein FlgK [Terracidiphilus sp.]|jgi:flagellar hook-associated protein 1 FlgK
MSLNASLSIAVQSLNAADGALQATNNNIANANTPGYTREVPVLESTAPISIFGNGATVGDGVNLIQFQSVRDELLQTQIQQETSSQSSANAQLNSLQQIQPVFTTSAQDIGTEMSAFFSSISTLSTDAASASDRQAVLSAGQNLATAFNTVSTTVTSQLAGLNTQVTQDVSQINQLTTQIAALTPQINALEAAGQDGGTLEDQQNQLILSLSKLTNLSVIQGSDGVTLTTGNGTALVAGNQSFNLQTNIGNGGMAQVLDQNGNDITSSITSGDLGGTIQQRDTTIPDIMNQLDTLANQFGTAINAAQATGYDENGDAGQDLFTVSNTVAGSAATIQMAVTDPSLIAASSDGTSGSNGNLANLSAVQTNTLPSGQTPGNDYANLVYRVGNLTSNANAESTATTTSLNQLNDQLNSVSGVSIDEESANLITYQQAYEAAARVVTTLQAMFSVTMSMGTAAAE